MSYPDVDYPTAVAHVRETQNASCAYMQRTLKIGYNNAARHIDKMEREGIVSKPSNTGKREVISPGDTVTCDCIDKVNDGLSNYNTRLTIPIVFGGGPQRLLVQTEQLETGRGKKKACAMFASFCPFCGTKVEGGAS